MYLVFLNRSLVFRPHWPAAAVVKQFDPPWVQALTHIS